MCSHLFIAEKKFGKNEFTKKKNELTFWKVFKNEIKEPMMILLVRKITSSLILKFIVGIMYSIWGKWTDSIFIFSVIILTILLEVQNEFRAKKAVIALSLQIPRNSQVIRCKVLFPCFNLKRRSPQNNCKY